MEQQPFSAIPRTEEEMIVLMVQAGMVRAYADLRKAAKKGRLTESDIGEIERGVLVDVCGVGAAAREFPHMDMTRVVRAISDRLTEFFASTKAASRKKP
ncbi:hypothetical protein [Ancylobacter mangrovi]|uniref:hypothetical protein n=1 Tax=Ancylobacter mangrovi TaxID=2972472 RepID=UPI002161516D|nr:hypothetical protein [Ancylobacter mangrovi]MCS0501407.1 hypothetical protein [Ancylobacter mangrovi]